MILRIVLLVFAALLLSNLYVWYLPSPSLSLYEALKSERLELEQNIPVIMRPRLRTNLFVGYSSWYFSLDPVTYDRSRALLGKPRAISYNLSYMGQMGLPMRIMALNVVKAAKERGKKFDHVMIEFSPMALSSHFLLLKYWSFQYWQPAAFLNWENRYEYLREMPTELAGMAWVGLIKAPDFSAFLPSQQQKAWGDAIGLLSGKFWTMSSVWNDKNRGVAVWPSAKARIAFSQFTAGIKSPANWDKMVDRYVTIHRLDSRFRISEEQFEQTLLAAEKYREVAERVTFVLIPYCPEVQEVADRVIDYERLIARVEERGFRVVDLRKAIPPENESFFDVMHVTPAALGRYMQALAASVD